MKHDFINNSRQFEAALIAAGVTAAAAGANALAQGKMNRKSINWAKDLYKRQRAATIEDWNKTNAYNSPVQQMQRLREAGLNPHLIYGSQSATNNAAPIQQTDGTTPKLDTPNYGAIVSDPVNQYIETKRYTAQQKLMDAQVLKTLTEVDTKQFDLTQKERLADTQAALLESILKGKQQDIQINGERNMREAAANSSNLAEAAKRIAKMDSDIASTQIGNELTKAQTGNVKANTEKINEEIDNLQKDGKIKDFEIALNKIGFTKSDPVYYRLAKTIVDSIGLKPEEIKNKIKSTVKDLGTKATATQNALETVLQKFLNPFNK